MSAQAPLSDVKLVYFASDGWQQCQAAPEGQQATYAAVLALCARVCAPGDVQDHQLVGANGAHVVDDATLAAAIGGTPTLYLQRPNAPHPDITSHEEVSFVPHPKTMTMAGEWEYFAAGSQHPFPYAIAELIDNSLRATRANATSRRIVVSLVTAAGAPGGLVSVWDNGCGMSLRALNEWAVMNLTMEDRGLQPQEAERPRATQGARGATKQLCSDLSYFGVGSKNAAFFMGRCITLASKSAENVLVHELQISADALEQRYQVSPDQVYRERIHKRLPGAPSVLQPKAAAPDIVGAWAAEETGAGGDGQPTFTRVVISDLKADILQQIRGEASENVCRQLAHLYHYYLHGPDGNVPTGAENADPQRRLDGARLPNRDLLPRIAVQAVHGGETLWATELHSIDDDLESRYLAAKGDELAFTIDVPGKGAVDGVLWYFPFVNDAETLPQCTNEFIKQAQKEAFATQQPPATQRPQTQGDFAGDVVDLCDEDDEPAAIEPHPTFEVFWQGRLIPGSSVASLPFIDAVRGKAGNGKDALPDEVFGRLRGALFLGPSWAVTRNKLKLRDNMEQLLPQGVPTERNLEKSFKTWLAGCHERLDKTTMFADLLPDQPALRKQYGERGTFFRTMSDGKRAIEAGTSVLCDSKTHAVARVRCVGVNRAMSGPGTAAGGFAILTPLPEATWGAAATVKLPLRRLSVPSDAELAAALDRELAKLPARLSVVSKAASLAVVQIDAGRKLPEMTIEVVNVHGKRLNKVVTIGGRKQQLTLCRLVFRLDPDTAWPPPVDTLLMSGAPSVSTSKGGRKGKKAKQGSANGAATAAPVPPSEIAIDGARKVLSEEIQVIKGGVFELDAVREALSESGRYGVLHVLKPVVDAAAPIVHALEVQVASGQPVVLAAEGPGADSIAAGHVHLGQTLDTLRLLLKDDAGNVNAAVAQSSALQVTLSSGTLGSQAPEDVELSYDTAVCDDGVIELRNLTFCGVRPPLASQAAGIPTFHHIADALGAQGGMSQLGAPALAAQMTLQLRINTLATALPLQLLPGVPVTAELQPGHPYEAAGGLGDTSQVPVFEPGAALPAHAALARDALGNICVPSRALTWQIEARSAGLTPSPTFAAPDASGVATLHGVHAARGAKKDRTGGCAVSVRVTPATQVAGLQAAVEAAAEAPGAESGLRVLLAPSDAPAELMVDVDGTLLQHRDEKRDGVTERVFSMGEAAAGSTVADVCFYALDEALRPAPAAGGVYRGKAMCGWMRKGRTAVLREPGDLITLPPLKLPEEVGTKRYDLRFWDAVDSTFDVSAVLQCKVCPAAPARWAAWRSEGEDSALAVDSAGAWAVPAGVPFRVLLELQDAFGNRCTADALEPAVTVLEEGAEHDGPSRLQVPGCALSAGWQRVQGAARGAETSVYSCEVTLCGDAGAVELAIAPHALPGTDATVAALRQPITILPGPPAKLSLGLACTVQQGSTGSLGAVEVAVSDAWGNPVAPGKDFEVTLRPAAIATDGSGKSAKVTARGSNRAKLRGGSATFLDVKLKADTDGEFTLAAYCKSRTLALEEGTAAVRLQPSNAVLQVAVAEASIPLKPVVAGDSLPLRVEVTTEDGGALAWDDAHRGLSLIILAPGQKSKNGLVLQLPEVPPKGAEANCFVFDSMALQTAGPHTVTAEWSEVRPGLPMTNLKSPACSIAVVAGAPADCEVTVASESLATLAASNCGSAEDRLALKSLHIQLLDEHGNAARCEGGEAQVLLEWDDESRPTWPGCALPALESSRAGGTRCGVALDGSVDFGDVLVATGTGRVTPDPAAEAAAPTGVNCRIRVQVRGIALAGMEAAGMALSEWTMIWEKEMLFSDDAARAARVAELSQAQRRHTVQARGLEQQSDELQQAEQRAREALAAARAAAAQAQQQARGQGCDLDDAAMASEDALRARIAQLHAHQAAAANSVSQRSDADGVGKTARFGHPKHSYSVAIKRALALQNPEVLGTLAQLGSVQDARLSELLSAHLGTQLRTLVVESRECRVAVTGELKAAKCDVPDIMVMTMCNRYGSDSAAARECAASMPANARALTRTATLASEPPLLCPLPHTAAIARLRQAKRAVPEIPYGGDQWPPGCVDFAFNLVRPAPGATNVRPTLFYTLLGRALVFTTLQAAEDYRTLVVQRLQGTCGDIVCLDGHKIRSTGIVCGSSFAAAPLHLTSYRFTQLPAAQHPLNNAYAAEAQACEALQAALQEVARCEEEARAACDALAQHDAQAAPKLARLQQQVGELDELMKQGTKRCRGEGDCALQPSQPRSKARRGQKATRQKRARSGRDGREAAAVAMEAAGLEDDDVDL